MPGFESDRPVVVNQVSATEWELIHRLVYHGTAHTFVVPEGQTTDFASVPGVLRWLVNPLTGTAAAILHDHLWREVAPAGGITYAEADGLLRQALGTLGVSGPRRYVMWAAVRLGSMFGRRGGLKGWSRDLLGVLGVAVPAAILAAPTVLLLPSLAVFWVVERAASMFHRTPRQQPESRP